MTLSAGLVSLQGRAQTILVGNPSRVAAGTVEHPLYEPYLAIDPANARHLLAAAIVGGPPAAKFEESVQHQSCAAFLSVDAGATWTRHDFATTRCFDPWVAITGDDVLVTMVASHSSLPQRDGLVGFHSRDGGRNWDAHPIGLGSNHDHPTMVVDQSAGSRRGWIYLSSHRPTRGEDGRQRWGLYMVRSRDGGKTFDDLPYVAPNNSHNLSEMPVVLGDGTLVASFVDATYAEDTGSTSPRNILFDRRRAWIVRSTDRGDSFSLPLFVTDACGPPPHYQLAALAADRSSGPFADRLYFACRQRGGGRIVVNHSRDRGETWTAPVAIQSPGAEPAVANRIPGLAVNDRGTVLVAWIEAPGGAGHNCEQRTYVSVSLDGGDTFSPGQVVSSVSPCPDTVTVARETGGDYFGVIALPHDRFQLLWSEMRDGVATLLTAMVSVAGSGDRK